MLKVEYRGGLYLPELDLWLDTSGPREHCIISHGHSDHIADHNSIVATKATARIFVHRIGKAKVETLEYGERRDYGNYALTLYPAGHCLGSAQILIEAEGERLLYTGDIKLRPSLAAERAVIVCCDTLVTESTFGHEQYRFPPDEEIYAQLYKGIDRALSENRTPVVLAYALGKSQEALEGILRGGYDVMLHDAVWSVTEIYRELGVHFSGVYERYDRERLKGKVLLAPPGCRNQPMVQNMDRPFTIMLTGWAMNRSAPFMYRGIDLLIPLSDHADFDELVTLCRETKAKRIITTHGPRKFAQKLCELGFNASYLAPRREPNKAKKQHGPEQLSLFT